MTTLLAQNTTLLWILWKTQTFAGTVIWCHHRPLLTYAIVVHWTKFVQEPSYFSREKSALKIMIDICEGRKLYGQSCHLDHQPGRTEDFTTFEAAAYDPDLKSIVCLFTVHMEGETEYHVAAGFACVQHKIKSEFTSKICNYMKHHSKTESL